MTGLIERWRSVERAQLQLDALLAQADPMAPLEERNAWLIELGYWLRRQELIGAPQRAMARASTRLRFLLQVLERNPSLRAPVVATVHSIFRDLDSVSLLCDTGVPQHASFWSELRERCVLRLVPATPHTHEWGTLLAQLFPRARDVAWIQSLDDAQWQRVTALFAPAESTERAGHDLENSMRFLVSQVRATALSSALRWRMGVSEFADSPFLPLERALDAVLEARRESLLQAGDRSILTPPLNLFRAMLESCRQAARQVFAHFDDHGVSVDLEFRVEGILARLARIELLLNVLLDDPSGVHSRGVLIELITSHQASQSIRRLWRQSFARLARKVVDRSAQTGEHYITRTGAEYRAMLGAAAGGGALTGLTVYLKFFITAPHWPRLIESLLASLNYAASFVLLQLLGLTLATKQPAMTAPALAARIDHLGAPEGMDAFVKETLNLLRSQSVAVFGNVVLVVPVCYGVQWLAWHGLGMHLIAPDKAQSTIASFSLLGPTPVFAALTGVLLWLSSLIAGWADNWFVYRRIGDVLAHHRRLRLILGVGRAQSLARYMRAQIAGFAGNLSLGFLLGMLPFFGSLFALPLEVRHVTLSAGATATAVAVLGAQVMEQAPFWWAVAGIALMALLNVGVSFMLAFQLALRSRDLLQAERWAIYRALLRAVLRQPQDLVWLPRARRAPGELA